MLTAKTGWLYVLDRATGEPVWPIEERPFPQSEVPGEQSWPTQPIPTKPEPYIRHTFTVDDISPYLAPEEAEAFRKRLLAATNKGVFTPPSTSLKRYTFRRAMAARCSAVPLLNRPPERSTLSPTTILGSCDWSIRGTEPLAAAEAGLGVMPGALPGQLVYQANCQSCHGADRLGTSAGVPLVYAADEPANNIVAGATRVDAATIRATVATGRNRMPAFPHITGPDLENLVVYLTMAPGGRGRGGFGRAGRGSVGSGAPPELIVGSGSAWTRPDAAAGRGRGAAPPYPEGVEQFERPEIAEYNTVGNKIRPPFTSIVKYDLNKPGIQWRIPLRRRSGACGARHYVRHRNAGDNEQPRGDSIRPRVRSRR